MSVCVSLHDSSALKGLVSSVDTNEMFSRMSSLHRERVTNPSRPLVHLCWLRYDGLILPQRELNTLKFSHAPRMQEKPPLSLRVDKYNINGRIAKPGRTLAEIGSKCMQSFVAQRRTHRSALKWCFWDPVRIRNPRIWEETLSLLLSCCSCYAGWWFFAKMLQL